jgi:hypothetical protein
MCSACSVDLFGLSEEGFAYDTSELMLVVIPAAALFLLWRLFVTNKAQSVQRLGLEDPVSEAQSTCMAISGTMRIAYVATALTTFALGVLIFNAYLILAEAFAVLFLSR